ncbi:hypothetical protein M405DRAFT_603308 [Rhizopogon salebrosus TDB-379]|nr:hypothetical protein M405DRAFT_603308 [Rhizopogon salebrosus TDB-379]
MSKHETLDGPYYRPNAYMICSPILCSVLHILCIIAAEGLLIIRIYVAWNSKRLLTFLLVFPVVCFVSSYILSDTQLVFNFTKMISNPIPDPGNCLFSGGSSEKQHLRVLRFVTLRTGSSLLDVVHPIQKVQEWYRSAPTNIFQGYNEIYDLHHDHVLNKYYPDYGSSGYMGIYHRLILMHSVLASRILFNLRESGGRPQTIRHKWEELTDIQFGSGRHSTVRSEV